MVPVVLGLLALTLASASAEPRFVVRAAVEKPAASADVTFEHGGLAQEDGRDMRVLGPNGQPVSFLLSYVDETCCRVLFDARDAAGAYAVQFGDLATNVPPRPDGVCATGRVDWVPAGGFASTAYAVGNLDLRPRIKDEASTLAVFAELAAAAAAAEKAEAEKQPDPARRTAFLRSTVDRGFGRPVPDRWAARVRAEIVVSEAGEYEFSSEGDRNYFRVLFVDGNTAKAVIPGWYGGGQHTTSLSEWGGKARLAAGRHVLELYTSLPVPDLRLRPAGEGGQFVPITGKDAFYEAQAVAPGELEAVAGPLVDAVVATVSDWLAAGRFANARKVCRVFRERFEGQSQAVERLDAAAEAALAEAYRANWLTEGKYPSRSGAVPEADFAPPFRAERVWGANLIQNRAWRTGGVWVEGRLIHGVPWDVQDVPWIFTSAVCAGDQMLYAGTKNGVMHAVSLASGKSQWTFQAGGNCTGSPLLYRGVLYFGTVDRRLYALEAETGRMLWNYPVNGWIEGSPCADQGLVLFGARDGFLYAVDAALGVERWKAGLGAPIVGTPSTDGQGVYVGAKNGTFTAVALADGQKRWDYAAGAAVLGGSCVSGGRVWFGDAAGKVHALATDTGKPAWAAPADVGGPVVAAPILVGTILYGGTQNRICWGLKADDGAPVWKVEENDRDAPGGFTRPPLYAAGRLFFLAEGNGMGTQFTPVMPPSR